MKLAASMLVLALCAAAAPVAQAPVGRAFGNPAAPVKIDLFSDFQCPGCKVLHDTVLGPVLKSYLSSGKVYIVHRAFPLPVHNHAREAAHFACAAAHIGKYEAVGNALFLHQAEWTASGKVEDFVVSVLTPAEAAKVRALAKDPAIEAEIERDVKLGAGISQTPTMMIRKGSQQYPISGTVNPEMFRRFLDDILSK